jgi:hypothetical protein
MRGVCSFASPKLLPGVSDVSVLSVSCWDSVSDNLHVFMQTPVGDANELDSAELQSVKLFQESTPSVVNISNISELPLFEYVSIASASSRRSDPKDGHEMLRFSCRGGEESTRRLHVHGLPEAPCWAGLRLHLGQIRPHCHQLVRLLWRSAKCLTILEQALTYR